MIDPHEERRILTETQSWHAEFERLLVADRESTLSVDGLERLALSAYMLDHTDVCADAWMRAHQVHLHTGDVQRAARCAFWQACGLFFRGEHAPALGWIARARRVLESAPADCVEQGWLLMMTALPMMFQGDAESASSSFAEAGEIAVRFGDADLIAFARLCLGQSLILQQHVAGGMALLDEVMVDVLTGELSPILTGIAYCATIEMCQMVFDLRRAREWTAALTRWCALQPDMVPYRGNCLIHRCEIFQLQGDWHSALDAAQHACDLLSTRPAWDTLGSAYYQLAEIQRLRGAYSEAEASYRSASRAGREPEPGMSLLHLARDNGEVAAAGLRRVLDEAHDPIARTRMLPAYVEVMLAVNDLEAAQSAANELRQIGDDLSAPYLHALAAHASGAVRLVEGDTRVALTELRGACTLWRELDARYQVARTRVLIGRAFQDLGDAAGAELEFDAARSTFDELGAVPDLENLNRVVRSDSARAIGGLSARESEVLTLVASGKTNRTIATELSISEKTVARHVSNIFTKLDLTSRTEATAYAYQHGLVH